MTTVILIALALVAVTVVVHAVGIAGVLSDLRRRQGRLADGFWPMCRLIIAVTWILLLLHTLEIAIWAVFYWWSGCMPDLESAFYFSGVTYATVGYGDLVLPEPWRILAPIEAVAGILMCGLSTGFFFAVVSRMHASRHDVGRP